MKKIIVVDNCPDVIYSIKEGLKNDFEIIGAHSGIQLFKTLESNIPDLVLLDIMMPEMNGWQVLKRLKENEKLKNIPVIIISVRKDITAKNAGSFYAENYIEKPFTINEVKEKINKLL
jgi:two-component system alkaline phosphatase synthesis response regulator PhoP